MLLYWEVIVADSQSLADGGNQRLRQSRRNRAGLMLLERMCACACSLGSVARVAKHSDTDENSECGVDVPVGCAPAPLICDDFFSTTSRLYFLLNYLVTCYHCNALPSRLKTDDER